MNLSTTNPGKIVDSPDSSPNPMAKSINANRTTYSISADAATTAKCGAPGTEESKKSRVTETASPRSSTLFSNLSTIFSSITVEPTLLSYTFSYMVYQPLFSFQTMRTMCHQSCGYTDDQCHDFGTRQKYYSRRARTESLG